MKTKTWEVYVIGAAIALALLCQPATAQTTTAQSAMFANTASGNFIITGTEVWSYNKDTAATYFSNAVSSGPVVTCNGNPTNCATTNQPAAPGAPAPESNKLNASVNSQSCAFWDGTLLTLTGDTTYKQFVTINGLNGNGPGKKHGRGKALSILAARLGRASYYMLRRSTPFDMDRFMN